MKNKIYEIASPLITKKTMLLITIYILLIMPSYIQAEPAMTPAITPTPTKSDVFRQIKIVLSDEPGGKFYIDAALMVTMVRRQDYMLVESDEVDALIALLDNSSDVIRFYAASAIGCLLSTGRRAYPELVRALKKIECVRGDLTSEVSIRSAIVSIGRLPPPPRDCMVK